MENNDLNDKAGQLLIKSLLHCKNIKHLNFNNNYLSTMSAIELDCLALESTKLTQLELHCNNLSGKDMHNFIDNLNNYSLQILDLSWNSIGNNDNTIKLLGDRLSENKKLYDLNLSNNKIKSNHVPHLFQTISNNHTLIGLDLNGNEMKVDLDGVVRNLNDNKEIFHKLNY